MTDFERAAAGDDAERGHDGDEKNLRIPESELRLLAVIMLVRLNAGENQQRGQITHRDEQHNGDRKIKNQQFGFFPGSFLLREEVHGRWIVND